MNHLTHIEPLEIRIAPATILNPYTVTFQDVNGDTAIVKISNPLFKNATAAGNILLFTDSNGNSIHETFTGNGTAENLAEINLLGVAAAQGMNISVKVIPTVGVGVGQVNVGEIAAANFSVPFQVSQEVPLGSIYIQGNLGEINAGSGLSTIPAIQSLSVLSMTNGSPGVQSNVLGTIGNLSVQGNFNANLNVIGYQFGSIGKLNIGGSLAADSAGDTGSGVIQFTGHVGSATIGNITGGSVAATSTSTSTLNEGTGELFGQTSNPSYIGSLNVLGSITGGSGSDSGRVFAESSIGKVTVGGSVTGGAGQDSGEIAGPLGTVNVAGGLTGGSGISSGTILGQTINTAKAAVSVAIGSVTIGGDVTGGTAGVAAFAGTTTVAATAAVPGNSGIISAYTAKSISIAGSLIGGTAGTSVDSNGTLNQTANTSGAVLVDSVGSLTIGKNIIGGSGPNSGIITGQSTFSSMTYGNIVVNGGVTGGTGATSGSILVNGLLGGTITNLHIGTNLTGIPETQTSGTPISGTQSGEVYASSNLGTLYIGGNVTGGNADNTGEIFAGGNLTNGLIKGNLTGGITTTTVVGSGYIQAGHIGTLEIDGNVTSGTNSKGEIANSGAIRSSGDISSLTIKGEVTGTPDNPVYISATQGPSASARLKTDVAIQSVTIDQAVTYLDLLAGYSPTVSKTTDPAGAPLGTPTDGSAQIGTVTFGSTLSASNLVAGAEPDSSGHFGTTGNTAIATKTVANVQSSIASIIVAGQATGDSTPADSFGFVAEKLETVMVNGVTILTSGLQPGIPVAVNGTNLFLLEVS